MGTDIHMVAQVKRPDRTWWETVGKVFPDPWYRPSWPPSADRYDSDPLTAEPYGERNYVVFSVLADVRNGSGFAGYDTGDRIEPIAGPRGLPDDFNDDGDSMLVDRFLVPGAEPVWSGDHSHSWLTLRELAEYDWEREIVKRGFVKAVPPDGETPTGWSSFVTGGNVETQAFGRNWRDARAWTESAPAGVDRYAQIEWSVSLSEYASDFLKALAGLVRLAAFVTDGSHRPKAEDDSHLDNLRIVFGFDS